MAGNLWEWRLNDHEESAILDPLGMRAKVQRSGSFGSRWNFASALYRDHNALISKNYHYSLQLVVAAPRSAL